MSKKTWKSKISIIVAGMLMMSDMYCGNIFAALQDEYINNNAVLEDETKNDRVYKADITLPISSKSGIEGANDADIMYSITEGSLYVPREGESASFTLKQDSYVEFDSKAGHDAWSLDEIKKGGTSGLIYSMFLPKRFLLKKGYHYMHLASASMDDGNLTYKVYPICGIYYPSGDEYKKVASYTLQSNSASNECP